MIPIVSLLFVLSISLLITRVATVMLTLTGLSRESARFQARSAFTGVGFTTTEAENVVNHPVRRRVVMTLMLLGNAGIVTAMSSFMLSFVGTEGAGQVLGRLALGAVGIAALWSISLSPWVEHNLERWIEWGLERWSSLDVRDYAQLLRLGGSWGVSELNVAPGDWIAGRPLHALRLADEGVLVLGVNHADGVYIGTPTKETVIDAGDTIVVYGSCERIAEIDGRKQGEAGDRAHALAVQSNYQEIEDAEKRRRQTV